MKLKIICSTFITQLLFNSIQADIQKIPFYYHQKRSNKLITAESRELYNGMLGATVQIGNPPQDLTLAFDTSIGYSWVRGEECDSKNCRYRKSYRPENSTTSVKTPLTFTMDYGNAVVRARIYQDTIRFSGITVQEMPFGNAYCMEGFNKGFDGFLGLGRAISLNTTEVQYLKKRELPPSAFVATAYQQGSGVTSAQFGMYTTYQSSGFSDSGYTTSTTDQYDSTFVPSSSSSSSPSSSSPSRLPNSHGTTHPPSTNSNQITPVTSNQNSNNSPPKDVTSGGFGTIKRSFQEPAGYLVFGGIAKEAIEGELFEIKIEDDDSGKWIIPVKSFKFEDEPKYKVASNAKAFISSNTDVIGLPDAQAAQFQKQWYAEYDKPDNTFLIPCCLMDRLSSIKITLGSNIRVTLPPSYWSHPRDVVSCCEMCRTHIGKSESPKDYVIGYSFTNAFYSHFNSEANTVGFAMKKGHKEDGLRIKNK